MAAAQDAECADTLDTSSGGDLTSAELALVSVRDKAGLVSHLACHFCGLQFDVKKTRSLRSHIEEVHVLGDAGYMCGICCEEFTTRKAVENHMSTFHRTPKPLGCGTCGETFRVRNLLLKHMESHTQEETDANKLGLYYCGECFQFFSTLLSLQIHSMTHREQPMFVCGACGLQTRHRHVMIKHLETHVISSLLTAAGKEHSLHEQSPILMDPGSGKRVQPAECVQRQQQNGEIVTNGEQMATSTGNNGEISEVTNGEQVATTTGNNAEIHGGDEEEVTHVVMSEDHIKSDPLAAAGAVEDETQEVASYKCGACGASFINLNDALTHAESHNDTDDTSQQMAKDFDVVEMDMLMPDGENTQHIHNGGVN